MGPAGVGGGGGRAARWPGLLSGGRAARAASEGKVEAVGARARAWLRSRGLREEQVFLQTAKNVLANTPEVPVWPLEYPVGPSSGSPAVASLWKLLSN